MRSPCALVALTCVPGVVQLLSKTLVGVLLVVAVKARLASHVTEVQGTTAAVGVLGVMGNKGAASIRLRYDDRYAHVLATAFVALLIAVAGGPRSTLCFVCSPLAAKRSHVVARNSDYASILNKTAFVDSARAER